MRAPPRSEREVLSHGRARWQRHRVEVGLRLDAEPRVVAEPPDLANALDRAPQARAAFDRLPYGLKRKHVRAIEDAQSPQTRQWRIAKLITTIGGGHST